MLNAAVKALTIRTYKCPFRFRKTIVDFIKISLGRVTAANLGWDKSKSEWEVRKRKKHVYQGILGSLSQNVMERYNTKGKYFRDKVYQCHGCRLLRKSQLENRD